MFSAILVSVLAIITGQAHSSQVGNLNLKHGRKLYANPAVVNVGSTVPFAVLAGTTVTNSGDSKIQGNLGLWPGSNTPGIDEAVITGHTYVNDNGGFAQAAHSSLTIAINDAASRASNQLIGTDLNGMTLSPGVYTSAGTMGLTGTLYLDAGFDENACWIFQLGTSLSIEVGSKVILTNQVVNVNSSQVNVFWNVGSSAAIKTGAQFIGTILAGTGITVAFGATTGPLLAKTAVTLLTNTVTAYDYVPQPSALPSSTPTSSPTVVFAGVLIGANVTLEGLIIEDNNGRRQLARAGSMLLKEESDKAIITAIATVLELPEDAVSIESEDILSSEDDLSTVQIELRILAPKGNYSSYEACFGNYSEKLSLRGDAILEQLAETAESIGAHQLYNVSSFAVTDVENNGVVDTSELPTYKDGDDLSTGEFAGMVIGIVVGSLVLLVLAYLCFSHANRKETYSATATASHANDSKEVFSAADTHTANDSKV